MTTRPNVISMAIKGELKELEAVLVFPTFNEKPNCDESVAEVFFEDSRESIAKAKAICEGCPILRECLQWGLKHENEGVWGGRTARERYAMRGMKDAIDPQTLVEASEDLTFILNSPSQAVQRKYDVNQRTVMRWRKILKSAA